MSYKYRHLILGGTFDLLHIGHKTMLSHAFSLGKLVTIGITSDEFNEKRGKSFYQNLNLRLKNLRLYLSKNQLLKRSQIIPINDIFGTTLKDSTIEAIVVTKSTKKTAFIINKKRLLADLKKLDIITIPFAKDASSRIISSTRIREGFINTEGGNYQKALLAIAGRKLSENVRIKLKKPLGYVISTINIYDLPVISIGDVTTSNLLKAKIPLNLAVIDGRVGRKNIFMDPRLRGDDNVSRVKNPPGQISRSLILLIDKAVKKFIIHNSIFIILVDGEEDLATIPAILLSPLGSTVCYGQPGKGLVKVKVDLKIKDSLLKILDLS